MAQLQGRGRSHDQFFELITSFYIPTIFGNSSYFIQRISSKKYRE
jgi:hypothetical protein